MRGLWESLAMESSPSYDFAHYEVCLQEESSSNFPVRSAWQFSHVASPSARLPHPARAAVPRHASLPLVRERSIPDGWYLLVRVLEMVPVWLGMMDGPWRSVPASPYWVSCTVSYIEVDGPVWMIPLRLGVIKAVSCSRG